MAHFKAVFGGAFGVRRRVGALDRLPDSRGKDKIADESAHFKCSA